MAESETAEALAARIFSFAQNSSKDPKYAATHANEAAAAAGAMILLLVMKPNLAKVPRMEAAQEIKSLATKHIYGQQVTSESTVLANMGPGVRDMYNQLLKDDPKQARAFLIREMMASLKLMGEILSNVSKTRSDISMTFARNARA